MKGHLLEKGRWWKQAARITVGSVLTLGAANAVGCLNRPVEPIEPRTTSTIVERLKQTAVDKIDLLLAIDNSRSMSDKQQILALAVPDLVTGLVNPKCLDTNNVAVANQPTSPTQDCPAGSKREFTPVVDIHIGIVTSSLGGAGSDSCPDMDTSIESGCPMGVANTTENDHGRLHFRSGPCVGTDDLMTTYQGQGFLAWDPSKKLNPVGETAIGSLNPDGTPATPGIVPDLRNMVLGLGQIGCGFESQNEGWFRFLADPEPFLTISAQKDKNGNLQAVSTGVDTALLQQRKDFLRSNSLLAVIVLTDENDASIKEYGQYFFVAQGSNLKGGIFHLPRGRQICLTKPDDPCCGSCGQNFPNCPADPTCKSPTLSDAEDPINLREWDSKRRFGIEFYYQPDRYVSALTQTTIQNAAGELVPNPIFSDISHTNAGARDPGLVFLAEIVGVPWQDIARQAKDGTPDLLHGDDKTGKPVGGFKTFDELNTPDKSGKTVWDQILGDYMDYDTNNNPVYHWGRAGNPLMIESVQPRSGTDPITGVAIAGPMSANGTNPINGHEWIDPHAADLQYACIFDLPQAQWRHCSNATIVSCDCGDPSSAVTNPLCENDPMDATPGNRSLQVRAKAYPGLKELSILKGVLGQGIVASICPKQVKDNTAADFGYRPAVGAIIDRLKKALGGQCLPRTLTPDSKGEVPCLILEARNSGGKCDCSGSARQPVSADHKPAQDAAKASPDAEKSWDCFCEIKQTLGDDLTACQNDPNPAPVSKKGGAVNGWCYVDATVNASSVAAAKITANCPDTEKRLVRFVGAGAAANNATLFITCSGQ